MASRQPGRKAGIRAAFWALAAVSAVGLLAAGCGSVSTGPGPAGSPGTQSPGTQSPGPSAGPSAAHGTVTLCRRPSAVLSVHIVHLGGPLTMQPGGEGPQSVSVSDTMARSLAAAACALPVRPPGVFHCPASVFDQYQLTFTVPGRVLPVVVVHASGCPEVTGLGPVRWLAFRRGFLAELARLMVISVPGDPVQGPLTGKPVHKLQPARLAAGQPAG
jgi:hypothetical protein